MAILNIIKKTIQNISGPKQYTFDVAGTPYCKDNIKMILKKSTRSDYIYQVLKTEPVLAKEPSNKHDKNAIMVLINGVKVGYVPASDNVEIGKLLDNNKIHSLMAKVTGGPKKMMNGEIEDYNFNIEVTFEA